MTTTPTEAKPSAASRRTNRNSSPPPRIVIQYPTPAVDGGRYAAKRCVGDTVRVEADIFRDGHDLLRAVVRYKGPGDADYRESEMERIDAHLGGVRWAGSFDVDREGRWEYTVEAWTDAFGTWRDELERKVLAKQHDLAGELSEGVLLLKAAKKVARDDADKALIGHAATALADDNIPESAKHDVALGPELFATVERIQPRHGSVSLPEPIADRGRPPAGAVRRLVRAVPALVGRADRGQGAAPAVGRARLRRPLPAADPPDRPHQPQGRNNALIAGPDDPGSPWAIGDETGGHDAVHPELGTIEDLEDLTQAAKKHEIDIALDFAIQCSADHPWLNEHPEWFHRRPDGTLKYAENPPKRYQDIYNVNWDSPDWQGLWDALLEVVLHWVDCGVKVFRVDNPHTKPFAFWAWLIEQVHEHDRDVVFLAEAFTRRAVMRHLAKIGFTQSYTYFTWKNSR